MEESERPAILIVDDTPGNIDVLAGILSPHYRLRAARDGIKALEAVERIPPDLILLDVTMPGIDGYEVCRRLKENPKTRKIPVLFVTALSEDTDETKGFEVGAMDYLTKPVSPPVVLARVKAHLSLALAQRELEKQHDTLQEIIRLREDVERITCHDLKSPLTAFISIPPMLMRDKNQTPEQIEMLEILHKSAFRMLEMVNRSLDLFKMERGTYRLSAVPIDVARIVRQIISEFKHLALAKKVEVSLWINGAIATNSSECSFPGEELLFFSMLSNLIKNAIEASPEGDSVCVTLNTIDGRSIEVTNNGQIPPEIQEHFQERYVTFGKKGGTGLGVYSARLMAKTLGGELRFQQKTGVGTCALIDLPKGPESVCLPSPVGPTPFNAGKLRAKMEVLVVDDYGYMRKIIGEILRQMGFEHIREAGDVEEAEASLRVFPYDLIISDWSLPGGTGLMLLQSVRSRTDGAQIPFVMVTGNASEEVISQAQKFGVTDFLTKPFSPDILKSKIDSIFGVKDEDPVVCPEEGRRVPLVARNEEKSL